MVKAATGGGGGGGGGSWEGGGGGGGGQTELLPIVFIVPKLVSTALERACSSLTGSLPYSLLGYGDVGVPGLLVALCLQFDLNRTPARKFWPYFLVASLG